MLNQLGKALFEVANELKRRCGDGMATEYVFGPTSVWGDGMCPVVRQWDRRFLVRAALVANFLLHSGQPAQTDASALYPICCMPAPFAVDSARHTLARYAECAPLVEDVMQFLKSPIMLAALRGRRHRDETIPSQLTDEFNAH